MSTLPADRREQKPADILGDSYDARQFKEDLISGRLRWQATLLSALNVGLLVFCFFDTAGAEVFFPFGRKGAWAWGLMTATLAAWLMLAAANWKSWAERRREGAGARRG